MARHVVMVALSALTLAGAVFSTDHVFVSYLAATPDAAAARPNTIGKSVSVDVLAE